MRTLTDDSKEEGYIYIGEAFITDRSASESDEEKKRVIIEAEDTTAAAYVEHAFARSLLASY